LTANDTLSLQHPGHPPRWWSDAASGYRQGLELPVGSLATPVSWLW